MATLPLLQSPGQMQPNNIQGEKVNIVQATDLVALYIVHTLMSSVAEPSIGSLMGSLVAE